MTDSNSTPLRELLSKLTDESLAVDEVKQLNTLLRNDPISQQQYLDHMLIHGLLEREFQQPETGLIQSSEFLSVPEPLPTATDGTTVVPPARQGPRSLGWRRVVEFGKPLSLAAMVLLVIGWSFWQPSANMDSHQSLQMTDPGFEQGLVSDIRVQPNIWYGDDVDVVERHSDIVPLEGNQMLRFVKSTSAPERGCEIYQIIPLDSLDLKGEPRLIEASAFFNATDDDLEENKFAFEIALFALAADPSQHSHTWPMQKGNALMFGGSQLPADTDSKSWQQLKTQLSLPPETRYLVVQLAVICTDEDEELGEFPGQFVDDVKVNLVSLR
ncbi:hypothetical protein [Schlesneria sp.]|uniref:hypothetical protein n=1 Tax=Schlesneria sp. TaxID=2762018 RepID=UPI002F0E06B5